MTGTTLPLFPLNTVLFPGGPLPLRIFETRYLDMVRHCLRESTGFGVVLIRSGDEAGSDASFVDVGTEATIIDFDRLEDGLLGITCRGRGRFRVLGAERQDDGLTVGRVEPLPPEPVLAVGPDFMFLSEALRHVLPELGELYAGIEPHYEDAAWVGHRLSELLPLAAEDKQALLEMNDPLARLAAIAPLIRRPE